FKRKVRRAGVALYTAPGNFQTHLEVYAEARDHFVTSATDFSNDTKLTGVMAEILWGSFLLGVQSTTETEKGFDAASTPSDENLETKATIVTVGWVPEGGGLSLVLSMETEEETDKVANEVLELEIVSVGLAFVF
ncbi:MAG: hypothetical protein O7G32_04830, partial [SAR324 cluster bacterium]|nr:hypothetical protein [SAR324 cluster bacterium]